MSFGLLGFYSANTVSQQLQGSCVMNYNAIQRNRFSRVDNYEAVPTSVWVLAWVVIRYFIDKKRLNVAELRVCNNRGEPDGGGLKR